MQITPAPHSSYILINNLFFLPSAQFVVLPFPSLSHCLDEIPTAHFSLLCTMSTTAEKPVKLGTSSSGQRRGSAIACGDVLEKVELLLSYLPKSNFSRGVREAWKKKCTNTKSSLRLCPLLGATHTRRAILLK